RLIPAGASRLIRTTGVLPIVSRMLSYFIACPPVQWRAEPTPRTWPATSELVVRSCRGPPDGAGRASEKVTDGSGAGRRVFLLALGVDVERPGVLAVHHLLADHHFLDAVEGR